MEIKGDFSKISRFVKSFDKMNKFYVKVGVLGRTSTRTKEQVGSKIEKSVGSNTNAEIAVIHEFGSPNRRIPPRSFLRMPIQNKGNSIVNQVMKGKILKAMLKNDIRSIYKDLGIAAEAVIQEAFSTCGFGAWSPLTPATIAGKIGNNPTPLVNTTQLEKSIASEVVSNE